MAMLIYIFTLPLALLLTGIPGEEKQKTYGFYRVEPYAVNHGHEQVLKWPFLLTFFLYQPADRGRSHIV